MNAPAMNSTVAALRFFFNHTVDRPDLARKLIRLCSQLRRGRAPAGGDDLPRAPRWTLRRLRGRPAYRVLFNRTADIVQRLQAARQELALEAAVAKLERYNLLVLDDLSYARHDQAETSVLFELISKRYERRSMLITANQPFGE